MFGVRTGEDRERAEGQGANANKTQLTDRPISGQRGIVYARVKPARHYLQPARRVLLAGLSLFFAISRAMSRELVEVDVENFDSPSDLLENVDLGLETFLGLA